MNKTRAIISDLVIDYRCAIRDNLLSYAEKCKIEIQFIFKNRHNLTTNQYGYPIYTREENNGIN